MIVSAGWRTKHKCNLLLEINDEYTTPFEGNKRVIGEYTKHVDNFANENLLDSDKDTLHEAESHNLDSTLYPTFFCKQQSGESHELPLTVLRAVPIFSL